jgi:hypothetical protein
MMSLVLSPFALVANCFVAVARLSMSSSSMVVAVNGTMMILDDAGPLVLYEECYFDCSIDTDNIDDVVVVVAVVDTVV